MNTLDAITARRAIKHYDPTHVMTEAEIRQLMEAALQAPTAFNIQHWRFVTVLDPEVRKQIRAVAWDQAQVTESSLLIVLCADKDAWKKDAARYWKNAPQPVQDFLVPAIGQYYEGRDQVQRQDQALVVHEADLGLTRQHATSGAPASQCCPHSISSALRGSSASSKNA